MPITEATESKLSGRHFINRRQFLGMGATVVAAAGYKALEPAINQMEQWSASDVDNDTFISQNADKLKHVSVGMTFCPERYGLGRGVGKDNPIYQYAQSSLTTAVSDLRMRDVRLGLRWETIEKSEGDIDLSFYDPFVRKMLTWGTSICITVGAKSPGSPEFFYPQFIKDDPEVDLTPGISIDNQSALGQKTLGYVDRLTDKLQAEYGATAFKTVQLENEPVQKVADYQQVFDSSYLLDMAGIVDSKFPDANILVNTSKPESLGYLRVLLANAKSQLPDLEDRLIIGDNFYYQRPGGGLLSRLPLLRHLDPISRSQIANFHDVYEEHHLDCRRLGIRSEVTEAQAEKWGQYIYPAESPRGLRFVIKRGIDEVLDLKKAKEDNEKAVLRVWGYEQESMLRYTGNFKDGNIERFDLIAKINRI